MTHRTEQQSHHIPFKTTLNTSRQARAEDSNSNIQRDRTDVDVAGAIEQHAQNGLCRTCIVDDLQNKWILTKNLILLRIHHRDA